MSPLRRENRLSDRRAMAGRGRKKSNRRMDAAVSVLGGGGFGPGFPGSFIRRTIKKLLKVYGGDDGWPFIQDNSYQLVIDTMLADQEEAKDNSKNGDDAGAAEAGEQVVEHGEPSLLRNSEACDISSYIPVVAVGEAVPPVPVPAKGEPHLDHPVGADAHFADVNWRDISCNDRELGKPSNESPDCTMEMEEHPRESVVPPRASPRPASVGENVVPPRPRRKPCYGWISETESEIEEEEDVLSSSRKRKNDWDVRPIGLHLQGF